ncbi:hypothetical protein ASG81_02005 [Paenibacillus sp. Soil522]|nr:hypothetical protein ASG81_02005 [Paenibacillus sp. Soil522]
MLEKECRKFRWSFENGLSSGELLRVSLVKERRVIWRGAFAYEKQKPLRLFGGRGKFKKMLLPEMIITVYKFG